tara:strand:+ start:178 stop:441 length:264 start_codon:yes stop_codon:yes gene_type:complete
MKNQLIKPIQNKASSIILINVTSLKDNGGDGSNSFGGDFCFSFFLIIILFLNNVNSYKTTNAIALLDLFITTIFLLSFLISQKLGES